MNTGNNRRIQLGGAGPADPPEPVSVLSVRRPAGERGGGQALDGGGWGYEPGHRHLGHPARAAPAGGGGTVTGSTGPGSSGREVLCGLALAERLRRRGAREPVLVTLAGPAGVASRCRWAEADAPNPAR